MVTAHSNSKYSAPNCPQNGTAVLNGLKVGTAVTRRRAGLTLTTTRCQGTHYIFIYLFSGGQAIRLADLLTGDITTGMIYGRIQCVAAPARNVSHVWYAC